MATKIKEKSKFKITPVKIIIGILILIGLIICITQPVISSSFIALDLRTAIPLATAAAGLVFNERAGINNIGADGFMLTGAMFTWWGTSLAGGNVYMGICIGMAATVCMALIFAFLTISLRSDQIVVGIAINMLALGLTTTIYRAVTNNVHQMSSIYRVDPSFLNSFGTIGKFLYPIFQQSILLYICVALFFILQFVLMKTNIGLKVRAVGEHPKACDTVGINVYRIRYGATLFGGLMCGLGGALLVSDVRTFSQNMTGGKGFIALATVIIGKYSVLGAFGGSLLFGGASALELVFNSLKTSLGFSINAYLILMIPYIVTIVALAGFIGKTHIPEASCKPYIKE